MFALVNMTLQDKMISGFVLYTQISESFFLFSFMITSFKNLVGNRGLERLF